MDPKMLIERTLKASVVMVIPFLFALLAALVLLGITVAFCRKGEMTWLHRYGHQNFERKRSA